MLHSQPSFSAALLDNLIISATLWQTNGTFDGCAMSSRLANLETDVVPAEVCALRSLEGVVCLRLGDQVVAL